MLRTKDWGQKLKKKRLDVIENIEGVFAAKKRKLHFRGEQGGRGRGRRARRGKNRTQGGMK